jgi:hypothetical protein
MASCSSLRDSTSDGIDLTLHLHGASQVVQETFQRAGLPGVLVNVTLPGLSLVYAERFRDTKVLFRILGEAAKEIDDRGFATRAQFRSITGSSFSAGFGGVRELLKSQAVFERIDTLIMADSIYAGYVDDHGGLTVKTVDRDSMKTPGEHCHLRRTDSSI